MILFSFRFEICTEPHQCPPFSWEGPLNLSLAPQSGTKAMGPMVRCFAGVPLPSCLLSPFWGVSPGSYPSLCHVVRVPFGLPRVVWPRSAGTRQTPRVPWGAKSAPLAGKLGRGPFAVLLFSPLSRALGSVPRFFPTWRWSLLPESPPMSHCPAAFALAPCGPLWPFPPNMCGGAI